jgi:hypothetical protein
VIGGILDAALGWWEVALEENDAEEFWYDDTSGISAGMFCDASGEPGHLCAVPYINGVSFYCNAEAPMNGGILLLTEMARRLCLSGYWLYLLGLWFFFRCSGERQFEFGRAMKVVAVQCPRVLRVRLATIKSFISSGKPVSVIA